MLLSNQTISQLKERSGLPFNKASVFNSLSSVILEVTGQSLGVTSLKRLFGYIQDDRATNKSTLDIIASFLGFPSWTEYAKTIRLDSDWDFEDSDTVWISALSLGSIVNVSYLNRDVSFKVVEHDNEKVLEVIEAQNSSLHSGDLAYIDRIRKGEYLEAHKVIRGQYDGSYRTNGEVKAISIETGL